MTLLLLLTDIENKVKLLLKKKIMQEITSVIAKCLWTTSKYEEYCPMIFLAIKGMR